MIVREGLRRLLETAPDIEILAEAENGYQAVRQAATLLPNIVLMDIAMPHLDGIGAARQICKKVPTAKVLILSAYHESREVRAAIEAGVAGFVMKQTVATELLRAIRETSKGNAYFSPEVSNHFLFRYRTQKLEASLTPREIEVLQFIAQGNSNKEIAAALLISIKTVEKHRQAAMKKTRTHEVATLTRYAISNGLIPCERPRLFCAPRLINTP